jgi:hypothetical protein
LAEAKAVRRRRGAGAAAVLGCENGGDFVGVYSRCGDVEERADDIADHFVEKSVGLKFQPDASRLGEEIEAKEVPNGVAACASPVCLIRKRDEIVDPKKMGDALFY